jgi:hypothetical protein
VKDKAIMNLPSTGKAIVDYRVKNRNIDETSVDGEPRYGADIEVFSIEAYEEEEAEEETGLRALENFINFGPRDRNEQGQFSPGSSTSPDDFRAAGSLTKKKVAIGAGGLLAAGGAAAALSPQIRGTAGRVGKSVLASAGRVLMRG